MKFVGIDLHKKLVVAGVMNQDRRVLKTQEFFRQAGGGAGD